jgi:membrane protease YdiL (CAAX protease family)
MNHGERSDIFGLQISLGEVKPAVVVLLPALLVTASRQFGSLELAAALFPGATRFAHVLYMFAWVFVLFGVIPACIARFFLHAPLREFGVRLGDWRSGLVMVGALFPAIAALLLLPASFTPEMRAFYPFDSGALHSAASFARLETARLLLFYTAWEFLFRGFVLFGLREYTGDGLAIAIQTVPSCLWHIGMPNGEILSSIAGGILFGVIAVRTKSMMWPLLLHVLIGTGLDFFIALSS